MLLTLHLLPNSVRLIRRALLDENMPESRTDDVRWFRKVFDYYRNEIPAKDGSVAVKLERERVGKLAGILREYANAGNIASDMLRGLAVALSDGLKRLYEASVDGKTLTLWPQAVKSEYPLDLEAMTVVLIVVTAVSPDSGGVAEEKKGIDPCVAAAISNRLRAVRIALRKGRTPSFDLNAEERTMMRAALRWLLNIKEQEWPERAKKARISVERYWALLRELGERGDGRIKGSAEAEGGGQGG